MFTGIVEAVGEITAIRESGTNRIFDISCQLDEDLKVDQSISHNGACLTVTEIFENGPDRRHYSVTAILETLRKTNLGDLKEGDKVNIERCLKVGQRLDGHFVQGHVDARGKVESVVNEDGSWIYTFSFDPEFQTLLVNKGSVCVNGVSLTLVDPQSDRFSVAIIPYTHEHTNFHALKVGDSVNLEFDILGKYLHKIYGDRSPVGTE